MRRATGLLIGAAAALLTPLWLNGFRPFDGLTVPPRPSRRRIMSLNETRNTVRMASFVLRRLAKLPRSPWRSTCLFRSTAACLALRWQGVPARIVIGARAADHAPGVRLHAWVEVGGTPVPAAGRGDGFVILRAQAELSDA